MMTTMKIDIVRSVRTEIELSNAEMNSVTLAYLQQLLGGEGNYVTEKCMLAHWTSFPHGSGTTEFIGTATPVQAAAFALLKLLRSAK